MKPELLKVAASPLCSFSMRHDKVPYVNNRWHYHPEIELIYFKEGEGNQFIGDNVSLFQSGEVILIGSNLPHYWDFDEKYFASGDLVPDVFVAHFCDSFWGTEFLNIPENMLLKNLLELAKRGIRVVGKTRKIIGELLEELASAEGSHRVLLLLQALIKISDSGDYQVLSSISFRPQIEQSKNDRINSVYQYSLNNYKRKIRTEDVAAVAAMSPNSFCRFFKSKTGKTYTHFLNEIRVGVACRLLIANKLSTKQICYEAGFNNFTGFHKFFKMMKKKTPLNYQREFMPKN